MQGFGCLLTIIPPPLADPPESRFAVRETAKQVFQYAVLVAITVMACGVMWYVSSRSTGVAVDGADVAKPPLAARPKALVAVKLIEPEVTELTIKQSGKIRSWEQYSLGFEVSGRVQALGVNQSGKPLDDGDRVTAGQMLARLDDRIYAARKSEAVAQFEKASSDLARDRRLYEQGNSIITDVEFQDTLTRMAVAKSQQEVAIKNLEDTVLTSPVDGAISRRMVEQGESVMANSTVFEIVQVDQLLLVVDVPESRVRELQARMREVELAQADPSITDPEDKVFRARVFLEGRDTYGNRLPPIDAEVYRIAQVADERTKLFEVEVRIDNSKGLLRPGMVATAELVAKRLLAYRAPESSVIFRDDKAYLFTVENEPAPMEAMFWPVGQTELHVTRRVDLDRWVDEGDVIVLPAADYQLGPVVTRGQQRLTGGLHVRVVNPEALRKPVGDATARRGPDEKVGVN